MSLKKSLLKSTAVYTILGFVPLFFAFFLTPLYTFYLDPEQMGLLNIFNLIVTLLVPFYTIGIDMAFPSFYFEMYKEKAKTNNLLGTTIGVILIIGGIFTLLLMTIGDKLLSLLIHSSSEFTFFPYQFFSIILPLFTVIYNLLIVYYRSENNLKNYSILSIMSLVGITAGTLIGIIYLKLDTYGAVVGKAVGYILVVVFFLILIIRQVSIKIDWILAKKLLWVGFPILLYVIIGQINYVLDRLLVEHYFKLSDLGVYSIAIIIASVIEIWVASVSNAISPQLYKLIKDGCEANGAEIRKLLQLQYMSILLVICTVIALAVPVVKLFISPAYHEAIYYIPILSVAFAGRGLYVTYVAFLFSSNRTRYLPMITAITLIITVLSSALLIPIYGITGIALSMLISKFIQVPLVRYFANKAMPFRYNFKKYYFLTFILLLSIIPLYINDIGTNNIFIYFLPLLLIMVVGGSILKSNLSSFFSIFKKNN